MQWVMQAVDLDKNDIRDFAMTNIHSWRTPSPALSSDLDGAGVTAEYAATDMVRDR